LLLWHVGEGWVLKFVNFEKVRFLAPPSGAVRQRTPELSINLNTTFQKSQLSLLQFCAMGDQTWKKNKLCHAVSARKFFQVHTSSH